MRTDGDIVRGGQQPDVRTKAAGGLFFKTKGAYKTLESYSKKKSTTDDERLQASRIAFIFNELMCLFRSELAPVDEDESTNQLVSCMTLSDTRAASAMLRATEQAGGGRGASRHPRSARARIHRSSDRGCLG